MSHPNEDKLRELYAAFAQGDLEGFLGGCTDDVTFEIPGRTPFSGTVTRADFPQWAANVIGATQGTFREDVLDVFANDDHGALLLHHTFERDGKPRAYGTAHVVQFRAGQIAKWREHPGSLTEFEEAWGTA